MTPSSRIPSIASASGARGSGPCRGSWSGPTGCAASRVPSTRGFTWCGNLKPAGIPALWLRRREGIPYGIILYGSELLLLRHRIRTSPRKRVAARWRCSGRRRARGGEPLDPGLCLEVLEEIGIDRRVRGDGRSRLGTDPVHFRPGPRHRGRCARGTGSSAGRWLLTVARLAVHKGIDTGLRVVAALGKAIPICATPSSGRDQAAGARGDGPRPRRHRPGPLSHRRAGRRPPRALQLRRDLPRAVDARRSD